MRTGNNTAEKHFSQVLEYYENSKGILKKCPAKYDTYQNPKLVQEAFGTAWLAVLKAVRGALIQRGVPAKQLPRSFDAYMQLARKHLAMRDGKLTHSLNAAYSEIHIAGYYGGDLVTTETVKSAFENARRIIENLSNRKMQNK